MRKHDDLMKRLVVGMIIFLAVFTAVNLYLFYATGGMEPATLITCVFSACVGEMGIMGMIQHTKTKAGATGQDKPGGKPTR